MGLYHTKDDFLKSLTAGIRHDWEDYFRSALNILEFMVAEVSTYAQNKQIIIGAEYGRNLRTYLGTDTDIDWRTATFRLWEAVGSANTSYVMNSLVLSGKPTVDPIERDRADQFIAWMETQYTEKNVLVPTWIHRLAKVTERRASLWKR